MKKITLLLLISLSGCASSNTGPSPEFYNGIYYLAGDNACTQYKGHKHLNKIMCFNSEDRPTGIRDPMTDQQLLIYQQTQAQKRASADQFYADLAAGNNALAGVRYPQMSAPQVAPIVPPGGNQIRCISTGIYTNCR